MDVSDADWSDHDDDRSHEDHRERHHGSESDHDHSHTHDRDGFCAPGGIEDEDVQTAYGDADTRWNNLLNGEEDTRRTFDVAARTDSLRVSLLFDLHGEVDMRLRDPLGRSVAATHFDGHKEQQEDHWYAVDDPFPGRWTLDIELTARGGYAVGVYR